MIIRGCYADRNRRAVGVVRGAQVFLHPALVANLHRIVSVVVVVRHGSGTWTRLTVEKRAWAEIQYDGLRLTLCLRNHLAFEFLSRNHSITFVNHRISVGERMVSGPLLSFHLGLWNIPQANHLQGVFAPAELIHHPHGGHLTALSGSQQIDTRRHQVHTQDMHARLHRGKTPRNGHTSVHVADLQCHGTAFGQRQVHVGRTAKRVWIILRKPEYGWRVVTNARDNQHANSVGIGQHFRPTPRLIGDFHTRQLHV